MKWLAVLMAMALAGGCVNPPIEGRADPYVPPQISFADADLANRTAVLPPTFERKEGILYVTVPVRNTSGLDLHIDYKVQFLNQAGAPSEPATGWIGGTTLIRNSMTYLRVNSSNANAADFHLQFRYAQ